jgi:RHS repeat-associated protein
LDSITTPNGVVNYTYDAEGNRTQVAAPTVGYTNNYDYDANERLLDVKDASGNAIATYSYFDNGNLQTVTEANGVTRYYGYDTNNRLTSISYGPSFAGITSAYTYTLDGAGRKLTATDPRGTTTYAYDPAGRLASESGPGGNNVYTYDGAGNRTSATIAGTSYCYWYDPNDRLNAITLNSLPPGQGGNVAQAFLYDANGNTKQVVKGSESYTQNWDFDNRLLSTTHSGGGTISYAYDADGIRIGQTAPGTGTLTSYLVDENTAYARVLAESTGSTVTGYDYGADLVRLDKTNGQYYYIYDGLGSTRALADGVGTIQQSINYDAYGQPDASSPLTSFLFSGQQYDPLTKLYYLRARYYNPFHGRFLSTDPFRGALAGPESLHRYVYAASDPANRADPSGEYLIVDLGATVAENEVVTEEEVQLYWNSALAQSYLRLVQTPLAVAAARVMLAYCVAGVGLSAGAVVGEALFGDPQASDQAVGQVSLADLGCAEPGTVDTDKDGNLIFYHYTSQTIVGPLWADQWVTNYGGYYAFAAMNDLGIVPAPKRVYGVVVPRSQFPACFQYIGVVAQSTRTDGGGLEFQFRGSSPPVSQPAREFSQEDVDAADNWMRNRAGQGFMTQ